MHPSVPQFPSTLPVLEKPTAQGRPLYEDAVLGRFNKSGNCTELTLNQTTLLDGTEFNIANAIQERLLLSKGMKALLGLWKNRR
jgi:hypothetical protein